MNTMENNKIIAEFLGGINEMPKGYILFEVIPNSETKETHFFKPDEMLFHSDWKWLIEVVEKIESLGFIFKTYGNLSTVLKKGNFNELIWNDEFTGNTKIESCYNICLEFIKWYNEQNKKSC